MNKFAEALRILQQVKKLKKETGIGWRNYFCTDAFINDAPYKTSKHLNGVNTRGIK